MLLYIGRGLLLLSLAAAGHAGGKKTGAKKNYTAAAKGKWAAGLEEEVFEVDNPKGSLQEEIHLNQNLAESILAIAVWEPSLTFSGTIDFRL